MWEFVKQINQFEELEVNSSLYAVKVYESFVFVVNGEIKNHNEMKFQNMKYKR